MAGGDKHSIKKDLWVTSNTKSEFFTRILYYNKYYSKHNAQNLNNCFNSPFGGVQIVALIPKTSPVRNGWFAILAVGLWVRGFQNKKITGHPLKVQKLLSKKNERILFLIMFVGCHREVVGRQNGESPCLTG